ncbi:hypothetical protein [Candidatus Poriferisodalis sp.]|uniref:hypothetical protein n=1 Tax=Candidatus Poriferisodalis sp. TaxID=3101277 RepID=UPI003B014E62
MTIEPGYLPQLQTREQYVDHLEGYAVHALDRCVDGKAPRKFVKTYMFETARHGHKIPDLASIFPEHVKPHRLDDTLYRVEDMSHDGKVIGLLECLDERHPVLYTTLAADESNRWVRQVIDPNPWLDRLWLSSPILFEFWRYVQRTTAKHRYVRLGFEHEAKYEAVSDIDSSDDIEDMDVNDDAENDGGTQEWVDRRRSKVVITERLSLLEANLPKLSKLYDPLHSLVQLQMPSGGRGGHLLYYDGRATNRAETFVEHRATIAAVVEHYKKITEHAEERLWTGMTDTGTDGVSVRGAPVTIRFSQPIAESTFNRFVESGLQRRNSPLRIGGYLTRRGPTKVHLAAIDRHLWQPLLLEVTCKQILGVLPRGTCGNTVHRLVTYVQRHIDPSVEVWLGSEPYSTAIADSMAAT